MYTHLTAFSHLHAYKQILHAYMQKKSLKIITSGVYKLLSFVTKFLAFFLVGGGQQKNLCTHMM